MDSLICCAAAPPSTTPPTLHCEPTDSGRADVKGNVSDLRKPEGTFLPIYYWKVTTELRQTLLCVN